MRSVKLAPDTYHNVCEEGGVLSSAMDKPEHVSVTMTLVLKTGNSY